jgi:hypothetical protein
VAGPAACGDDESPFTATGVTKPQYVSDGDQICREAERSLDAVSRELARDARGGDPASDDVARAAEEEVIPIVRDRIADLRALEPPPGDEEEVDRIYDAAEDALAEIEERPERAEQADEVFREASRLASEYGFQDCTGV